MEADKLDFGQLESIIGSLSKQDMEALEQMAKSLFSQQPEPPKQAAAPQEAENSALGELFSGFDAQGLAKTARIMGLLNQKRQPAPSTQLLTALRPLLKKDRQQKVDQAIKMLELLNLLPQLKSLTD